MTQSLCGRKSSDGFVFLMVSEGRGIGSVVATIAKLPFVILVWLRQVTTKHTSFRCDGGNVCLRWNRPFASRRFGGSNICWHRGWHGRSDAGPSDHSTLVHFGLVTS